MGDRLPETIIQKIQSFLTARNCAKTSILSKAWRRAWLTRPNLDFDLPKIISRKIESCTDSHRIFSEFAEKTLKRYEDSNLKIESFNLCEENHSHHSNSDPWIVKALQLGATRLTLRLVGCFPNIPDEVFQSENLLALTLNCCQIKDLDVIPFSMLQSLSLTKVKIVSSDLIFRILSSCPSIHTLSLSRVGTLNDPRYDVGTTTVHGHGLRSLVLVFVDFDTLFLGDLSSIFPSLKELTLRKYSPEQGAYLNISSHSLERVNFMSCNQRPGYQVKFDVPSIRKFTFEDQILHKLSVRSSSSGSWESHVSINQWRCLDVSWFCRLSKFLSNFRRSRISLSLRIESKTTFDYEAGDIQGLPILDIENLNIYHDHLPSVSCLVLFDGLFRIFRPKFITEYVLDYASKTNIGFLGKKLVQVLDVKIPTPDQFMYGLNDVKEVRAEIFDEVVSAWREVPLDDVSLLLSNGSKTQSSKNYRSDALSEDSVLTHDRPKVRFQLNWKE